MGGGKREEEKERERKDLGKIYIYRFRLLKTTS
jgi:hypothetical protein